MNTKKLFGMIIGVTAFGVLIAGATFAWLSFGVTIGENVLTANTLNFIVDYSDGGVVRNLPILDSNYIEAKDAAVVSVVLKKNPTSPEGHASIWLNTTSETALTKAGVVRWVICRDDQVETEGEQIDNSCGNRVLMKDDEYVVDYNSDHWSVQAIDNGMVTGKGPIPLLSDAHLANEGSAASGNASYGCSTSNGLSMCAGSEVEDYLITSSGTSYFIYMWLEAEPLINAHLDEQYQKTGTTEQYLIGKGGTPDYAAGIKYDLYSGYVFASATQLED